MNWRRANRRLHYQGRCIKVEGKIIVLNCCKNSIELFQKHGMMPNVGRLQNCFLSIAKVDEMINVSRKCGSGTSCKKKDGKSVDVVCSCAW